MVPCFSTKGSANDLEPTSTVSQYKADDDEVHEQERDVSKFWKQNRVTVALIGAENQTGSDPDMIFRVIGYDGASYRSQVGNEGKRYPVITLVLYFGYDHHWNQKREDQRL